ncbi:hypothetical protein U14_01020 [Candidatus Moduliflexus flocculans]|uniref:Helicase HerA central domain-containing protein n=1 Tax=Candidatus Moduliflexus flocculans TaxID=1499966 RepID=A0A0S6VUR8_9BACT|nr:hypothetical protein U14_01020 [Candidatus Moduliflexus flocculans]
MKPCPKCGESLQDHYYYHKCGWDERKGNKADGTQNENPVKADNLPQKGTNTTSMKQIVSSSEKIGTIGSPSSTSELSLDILATAVDKRLVGELAYFEFVQDGKPHYALGQITEVELRNTWLEGPTMKSLARQRGTVNPISGLQDTHSAKMTLSAVFSDHGNIFKQSGLGTVPATGTSIYLANDDTINKLLEMYQQEIFYLGHVYGSAPKLPLWFKHFDSGKNGAGEAYHLGIFGKTGSGKSVLAKMILLGYARHPEMSIFIFDPQGEFALGLQEDKKPSHMGEVFCQPILKSLGRNVEVYDLQKIKLDRWELFTELLLEFGFFFELGVKATDYQRILAESVEEFLRNNKAYKLENLDENALVGVLTYIKTNIRRLYSGQAGVERVQEFVDEILTNLKTATPDNVPPAKEKWLKTAQFFIAHEGSKSPMGIVKSALMLKNNGKRPAIIIDLSKKPIDIRQSVWDEKIKPLLIDRFLDALGQEAELSYQGKTGLNTLVVLDEAHRLAPAGKSKNERIERIKMNLVDAIRTTRKYGLGWMFISQTLSSIDNDIIQQLSIYFFGFGLSMGTEFQKLRELVGGQKESLNLYQRFRHPQSSFDASTKEYSFMTIGPVSPLSFSGTPLFLSAFNSVEDFIKNNALDKRNNEKNGD